MMQVIKKHTGVYPLVHKDIDRYNNDRRVSVARIRVLTRDVPIDLDDQLQYTDVSALSHDSRQRILDSFPDVSFFRLYLFKTPIPDPTQSCTVWGFFYLENRIGTL
jgi:hypothetical protein